MNAVAYIRVSSTKQLDGDGPERQRSNIAAFAGSRFNVVREFVDDISGTKEFRPAFDEMVAYCSSTETKTILVDKTDRFTRDLFVGLQLIATCAKAGLNVIDCATGKSITQPGNATEQMIVDLLMVIAQFNKNLLVETMAAARQRIRTRDGKCEGAKGYHDDPDFPQGPEIIARATELRRSGLRYRQIAKHLQDAGFPTKNGGRWHAATVLKMLRKSAG